MHQAPKYSVGVILAMIDQLPLVVEVMNMEQEWAGRNTLCLKTYHSF